MKQIKFLKNETIEVPCKKKPIIKIIKIDFYTNTKDWYEKLQNAVLTISVSCQNEHKDKTTNSHPLFIKSFISTNNIHPVFKINKKIAPNCEFLTDDYFDKKWQIKLELSKLKFDENDILSIEYEVTYNEDTERKD